MAIKEMKTFTLKGSDDIYEIVDEYARQQLKNGGAGGGAKVYNVNFTVNEDMSVVTADKSVAETITAYYNGQLVIALAVVSGDVGMIIAPISMVTDGAVVFSTTYGQGSITISGLDGSVAGLDKDVWDMLVLTLTTLEDVDKKIAEAIGTVENGSY